MNTKILSCKCKSWQQDTLYGATYRVMNRTGKGQKSNLYRCTVCKQIHQG